MTVLPHTFRDASLFELALTHASLGSQADNERLEFLGDSALGMLIAEELFRRHPELPEGALTELKAGIVSRATLAEAARALELEALAHLGAGLESRTLPRSVLANLYEALLGAVYLDAGLEAAREFVLATLGGPLERARAREGPPNYKQTLQHWTQKHDGTLPRYELLETRGEAHARAFLVRAVIRQTVFPSAWGRSLKEAESWAAHEALLVLAKHESS